MPQRLQRRRTKGYRLPVDALYVGRPSRWGNPFRVIEAPADGDSAAWYRVRDDGGAGLYGGPDPRQWVLTQDRLGAHVMAVRLFELHTGPMGAYEWDNPEAVLAPLRGRDLACWCPLVDEHGDPVPCHADVLLDRANASAVPVTRRRLSDDERAAP